MKSVRFPQRKMYIVAGLTPSEEATGGAWFTDGALDEGLITVVADFIETFVSGRSWREDVAPRSTDDHQRPDSKPSLKRRMPDDGFDTGGRGKTKLIHIDDDQPRSETPGPRPKAKPKTNTARTYSAYPAGHSGYPSAQEVSVAVNKSGIANTIFPQNAIEQLLQVMVYDDKLQKMHRDCLEGEMSDESAGPQVTIYRATSTPDQVNARFKTLRKVDDEMKKAVEERRLDQSTRKSIMRPLEIEDIGHGGITEVPCLRCPVIDLCEDEGPISILTCGYFDDWLNLVEGKDPEELAKDGGSNINRPMAKVEVAKSIQAEAMMAEQTIKG